MEINKLLADGATVDELAEHLKKMGHNIARSSVGRYSQQAKADIMAKIKDQLDLTSAWGEGLELDEENKQDRQILGMLRYIVGDYQAQAMYEGKVIEPKEMRALGQTMKDVILSRSKIQDITVKARREALAEAVDKAENVLNEKLGDKNQAADVLKAIKEAYGA